MICLHLRMEGSTITTGFSLLLGLLYFLHRMEMSLNQTRRYQEAVPMSDQPLQPRSPGYLFHSQRPLIPPDLPEAVR